MAKVTMLTIVPKQLAMDLNNEHRIQGYNTLPQLNRKVLDTIRQFFSDKVGYSNLPMACLMQPKDKNGKLMIQTDFNNYLPTNNQDSVLFLLEMPDDLIVSTNYGSLLEISEMMTEFADDESMLEFYKDELMNQLQVGIDYDDHNLISFIPFLDYSRCKFFAAFDSNFEPDESLKMPGLSKLDLRELQLFID